MQFFDAHTHRLTSPTDITSIYNVRLGKDNQAPTSGYFSTGIHPFDAQNPTDQLIDQLHQLCTHSRCVAIGETGVDRMVGNLEGQIEVFKIHCSIAQKLQKPLIIHCVRAQSEILAASEKVSVTRIFHSYSKVNEQINHARNIIYSLSMRNIAHSANIDLNQILLETDDSTSSIEQVYQALAIERKMSIYEVARVVEQNFLRTFAL